MKTFLIIAVTAAITWITFSVIHGFQTDVEKLWMISAVKVPGQAAIKETQTDMHAGRFDLAKAKINALGATWQRFNSGPDSCRGPGIGDIMVSFSKIDTNQAASAVGNSGK